MSGVETVVHGVLSGCIVVFVVTWLLGALYFGVVAHGSRERARSWLRGLRASLPARIALVACIVVLQLLTGGGHNAFWQHLHYWNPVLGVLGAALAVASTALLVWARLVLGAMWASVPLVQEGHELRTSGPYSYVRHPIYTGFLGVVVGAMLGFGFGMWVLITAVVLPWLLHRVRVEDDMMAAEFGDQYLAYRLRVPALLPLRRIHL
ncbi:isoprenylcysteine carboxylmethyltransferase family protein [Streptacidiphilus pinicola]|uniref:Isoprenylcysteine carboxylmethyltransferase family protein n=1 Tax=Streptacidiphilus pinicola TaxID=2219663 RepID=A0A2X0IP79_9ACTN|nr:isoprenylcysteine carboxylmethyltransferase family protein [Streptacidiphilus pinicola]RAG87004.1 isoprenylcysteine carboxylmethyltransferase family protein [Streptacidiphilus pinicola]